MKTLILTLLLLFVPTRIDPQSTKTTYDKFRDEITLRVGPDYVDIKGSRLEVALYVSSKGQKLSRQELIIGLAVYSSTRTWRFLSDDYLIILLDGKRLEIGKPIAKDSRLARYTGVDESLSFRLSEDDLRAISNAKQVEMQIGSTEFKLREKFIKRLAGLVLALPST